MYIFTLYLFFYYVFVNFVFRKAGIIDYIRDSAPLPFD